MALDLIDELCAVAAALGEAGVDHAVCGGLALAVHGYPRMTKDIDVLVRPEDIPRALEVVRALGFDVPARQMVFGLKTGKPRPIQRVSKLDPETGELLPLDLLHVVADYAEAWAGRLRYRFRERDLVVVSRDGLVMMKRIAGRPQDLLDIAKLEGTDDDEET